MHMEDPLFLKILIVGDSGVGKTSLLNKFCYKRFDNSIKPTIGCDFTLKAYENFEGKKVRLQLWDIAGIYKPIILVFLIQVRKDFTVSQNYIHVVH